MTAKEEGEKLIDDFSEFTDGADYQAKAAAIMHLDKCIVLLKTVMGNCSSTSERYELTNLIKRYKEIKLELEK